MNEFIIYYKNQDEKVSFFIFLYIIIIIFVGVFYYLYKVRKLFVFESSYDKKEFFFYFTSFFNFTTTHYAL